MEVTGTKTDPPFITYSSLTFTYYTADQQYVGTYTVKITGAVYYVSNRVRASDSISF